MICVYDAACTDFSNNGLGPINPSSCQVTETLNGEYELTVIHPIDEIGKWQRLVEGNSPGVHYRRNLQEERAVLGILRGMVQGEEGTAHFSFKPEIVQGDADEAHPAAVRCEIYARHFRQAAAGIHEHLRGKQ